MRKIDAIDKPQVWSPIRQDARPSFDRSSRRMPAMMLLPRTAARTSEFFRPLPSMGSRRHRWVVCSTVTPVKSWSSSSRLNRGTQPPRTPKGYQRVSDHCLWARSLHHLAVNNQRVLIRIGDRRRDRTSATEYEVPSPYRHRHLDVMVSRDWICTTKSARIATNVLPTQSHRVVP